MPRRFFAFAAMIMLLAIAAAPAREAVAAPRVVVSIAPLHSLVAAVMRGSATPRLLLRGGESPHTFSLRPSDARLLHEADILFWIGPPLEQPLARILPNLGVARSVSMLEIPGLELLPARHLRHADDAGHVAGTKPPRLAPGAAVDPHIWLSPANASVMAAEIARVLTIADAPNAPLYRSNAVRLQQRLAALDRELADQLTNSAQAYAVFHDAFQYLEHRYALQSVGAITTHPERSPGAAHLRELRALLIARDVRCLFSEPQFQSRLVRMLGDGLDVRHTVLDPLGADIPPGPEAYLQLMHAIADGLSACLHGHATP